MTRRAARARLTLSASLLAILAVPAGSVGASAAQRFLKDVAPGGNAAIGMPVADDLRPALPDAASHRVPKVLPPGWKIDPRPPSVRDPNARMLMEAKELVYDYNREVVTAVGKVDIYYDGRALQADRVAYDQKTKRVRAIGSVRMTERTGNVIHADSMDVTDDFRDGFISPLRVETVDQTHFAAAKGRREDGKLTVFDRGVYTACEPCRENPDKPPLWQVKAKRIIWREDEKTIYYEDATFELFGYPIAWLPFFSSPDPTVKRRTGVLAPALSRSGKVGFLLETPYYWALSPTQDFTLSPVFSTKQGVMLKGEYRQQLIDGAYLIRAAGIHQLDSGQFNGKVPALNDSGKPYRDAGLTVGPGDTNDRWAFSTKGHFDINEKWSWGWDINAVSDKWVRRNYNLWGPPLDATSTVYLTGQGNRSWFEIRAYHFYGLTRYDQQDRLPWIAPVVDYNYTFDDPVAGGELSFNLNATNSYRQDSDFARNRTRLQPRPDNALVGMAGTYSRFSADAQWRRQFIDPIGQVWTPFAFLRGDLIYTDPQTDPRMGPFLDARQDALMRGMAGVGLEYRFPFIAETANGSHQIEPIAQVILRPNETKIGRLPNEDAQSLLFDDTILFKWDKFSGYDRIEGGSRANVGAQYTFTSPSGATATVIAGQSYQLAGKNSFNQLDATRTGIDTGLDTKRSDYVGGVSVAPNENLSFAGHLRVDEKSFEIRSAEIGAQATFDKIQAQVVYGRYDQQPLEGYRTLREGVLGGARVFVRDDIYVEAGARYNFEYAAFDRTEFGFGMLDIQQCLSLSFLYIREIDTTIDAVSANDINNKFLFKVDLRTIGSATFQTRSRTTQAADGFGSTGSSF